ncbi:hypothetical protein O181_111588 [Austropuccinia psidii MF-1]|uniref:Uncharacterized protein n=1 Tax=Austropuccinia psidii MF-1 TaxID=1389203 RepID=A0A9Q3JZT2_9BASI|nr:hypothetical protein [Austropuccinia psidii MF-1]
MDLDQDIEAQMEAAIASTSSQRLASTFDTLIESSEADKTAISVVRPESLSTGNNRDIPVSVQELVYVSKAAIVGASPKSLHRHHELIPSSEEAHVARKDKRTSEGLDTDVFQRRSPTHKSLVEKPKHVIRGSEEEVGPKEGKQPSGSSPSLHKEKSTSTSAKNPKKTSKTSHKGKQSSTWECQIPNGTSLTHRITGFPRKRRQPWTMCSKRQEL